MNPPIQTPPVKKEKRIYIRCAPHPAEVWERLYTHLLPHLLGKKLQDPDIRCAELADAAVAHYLQRWQQSASRSVFKGNTEPHTEEK